MAETAYVKGRKLEYATMADLEDNGYTCWRTAGSHGKTDIIALKPGELLFIQCKLDGKAPPAERFKLRQLAQWAGASPLLAGWVKPGRAARFIAYVNIARELDPRVWTPNHGIEDEKIPDLAAVAAEQARWSAIEGCDD